MRCEFYSVCNEVEHIVVLVLVIHPHPAHQIDAVHCRAQEISHDQTLPMPALGSRHNRDTSDQQVCGAGSVRPANGRLLA